MSQTPSTPAADAPLAPGAELYGFRLHSATSVPEVRPMREPFFELSPRCRPPTATVAGTPATAHHA